MWLLSCSQIHCGPEIDLDEVHRGLEVEVLEHVARGDLVKVAVAEGGIRSDPDVLHQLDAVLLAELGEGQGQILEVLVLAGDGLAARRDGKALVAALGDAAVSVDVVALVLGLQQLAEELDLLLHLQQARDLQDVLLGLEGLDDLALAVLVVAVELGAVVRDAAELLHVVHGIVGGNAHDGAHLVALAVVLGRPAFAADSRGSLENRVVGIPLLLEIHAGGEARGAAADDGDANVLVHFFPPFISFGVFCSDIVIIQHGSGKCTIYFCENVAKCAPPKRPLRKKSSSLVRDCMIYWEKGFTEVRHAI